MKTLTPTLAMFALLLGAPATAFAGPGAMHRVSDGKVEEIPGGTMLNERLDSHVERAREDIDRAKDIRQAERERLKDARRHRRQMRADRFRARTATWTAGWGDDPERAYEAIDGFEHATDELEYAQEHVRWHKREVAATRENIKTQRQELALAKAQRENSQAQALVAHDADSIGDPGLYQRQVDRNAANLREQQQDQQVALAEAHSARRAWLASK